MVNMCVRAINFTQRYRLALQRNLYTTVTKADTVCRPLTKDDEKVVRDLHCNQFIRREPVSHVLHLEPEKEGGAWFDRTFPLFLKDGFSVGAVHLESNRMAGFTLCAVAGENIPKEQFFPKDNPAARHFASILDVFGLLHKDFDLCEKYKLDEFLYVVLIAVHEDFQQKGIAGQLADTVLAMARERGIKLVATETTGKYSRKMAEKHGFQALADWPYAEITVNGKPIEMTKELKLHEKLTFFVKEL